MHRFELFQAHFLFVRGNFLYHAKVMQVCSDCVQELQVLVAQKTILLDINPQLRITFRERTLSTFLEKRLNFRIAIRPSLPILVRRLWLPAHFGVHDPLRR